jgi:Arc/MetJ family transcription regulator
MHYKYAFWRHKMRTTLVIDEDLIDEAKEVSGAKTKKEAIEKALREFIRKRKSRKLLDLEGKVELSYTVEDLIKRRRKDVPHR